MRWELLDRQIAQALQVDGRAAFSTIAQVLGVSDQTLARRYQKLRSSGAVRVVGPAQARRLGQVEWLIRLRCVPDAAAPIATALAQHTEVAFAAAVTGPTNVVAVVACRDVDALYDYVANRLGPIEETSQLETAPVIRAVKRAGALLPTS